MRGSAQDKQIFFHLSVHPFVQQSQGYRRRSQTLSVTHTGSAEDGFICTKWCLLSSDCFLEDGEGSHDEHVWRWRSRANQMAQLKEEQRGWVSKWWIMRTVGLQLASADVFASGINRDKPAAASLRTPPDAGTRPRNQRRALTPACKIRSEIFDCAIKEGPRYDSARTICMLCSAESEWGPSQLCSSASQLIGTWSDTNPRRGAAAVSNTHTRGQREGKEDLSQTKKQCLTMLPYQVN